MSNPAANQAERTTSFELVVPPDAELLRVVRLVASGLASFTALDLDSVEEIRVGADELVATLMQASDGGPVSVSFIVSDEGLTISGSTALADGADFVLDPLTDRILNEVATEHSWHTEDGRVYGRIDHALPAAP